MSTVKPERLPLVDITSEPVNSDAFKEAAGKSEIRITLHFSLALENGDVIDTNFDKPPVSFTLGDSSLLPAFEKVAEETPAGERKTVTLSAEQAFGAVNEDNVQMYPHYQFPADMALEEGLMVSFRDQAGNEQAGVVRSIDRAGVTMDFNHPLAGKNIVFSVWIKDREQVGNEH